MTHEDAIIRVARMIKDVDDTTKNQLMKDEEIENHFDKVMEVFEVCLKFQDYEKKHYKTFG